MCNSQRGRHNNDRLPPPFSDIRISHIPQKDLHCHYVTAENKARGIPSSQNVAAPALRLLCRCSDEIALIDTPPLIDIRYQWRLITSRLRPKESNFFNDPRWNDLESTGKRLAHVTERKRDLELTFATVLQPGIPTAPTPPQPLSPFPT